MISQIIILSMLDNVKYLPGKDGSGIWRKC